MAETDQNNSGNHNGQASTASFDLIVIGGNLLASIIVREAATRGLKALSLQFDGLSYETVGAPADGLFIVDHLDGNSNLLQARNESNERNILKIIAPQLVEDLSLIIPRKEKPVGTLTDKVKAALPDYLAVFNPSNGSEWLDSESLRHLLPGLNTQSYPFGQRYSDLQVNSNRLAVSNFHDAMQHQSKIASHIDLKSISSEDNSVQFICQDQITGQEKIFSTTLIIDAADQIDYPKLSQLGIRVKQSAKVKKYFSFFIPSLQLPGGLLLPLEESGRILLVLPYGQQSLVVFIDQTDSEYQPSLPFPFEHLPGQLQILQTLFPAADLKAEQTVGHFVGYTENPILSSPAYQTSKLGKVDLLSVNLPRLALSRPLAVELIDQVFKILHKKNIPSISGTTRLPGSQYHEETLQSFLDHRLVSTFELHQLPVDSAKNILHIYGSEVNLFDFIPFLSKPHATELIFPESDHLWVELYYSMAHEFVRLPSDFALLRTNLFLDLLYHPVNIPGYFQAAGEILQLNSQQISQDQQKFLQLFQLKK